MEIRHRSRLKQMCANFTSPMQEDSPEIRLMRLVCAGQADEARAINRVHVFPAGVGNK